MFILLEQRHKNQPRTLFRSGGRLLKDSISFVHFHYVRVKDQDSSQDFPIGLYGSLLLKKSANAAKVAGLIPT